MTQSIDEIVVGLIARHAGVAPEKLDPGTDLASLGITSLDAITLAYELEEALGVDIPNPDIKALQTVQDLVDGLGRLVADNG